MLLASLFCHQFMILVEERVGLVKLDCDLIGGDAL
jgi:hypothetical protein